MLAAVTVTAGVATSTPAASSAAFTVGARVRPIARIERLAAPAAILLTDADLARGWVDLPEPVNLEVRANTRGGCDLQLDLDTDVALAIEIGGLRPEPVLLGSGGRFGPTLTGPGRARLSLPLRLHLAPGVRAGLQPFPVRLSAAARP